MNSEFRKDIVSGEWVLFAPARNDRPHTSLKRDDNYQPKSTCPFEDLSASGHSRPLLTYPSHGQWEIQVVTNKYPALDPGVERQMNDFFGFETATAAGHHELVVFRDHDRQVSEMDVDEVAALLRLYRDRYSQIAAEKKWSYILIFNNFGLEGGASIYHPHSQIVALPILPPDVSRSVRGAEKFYAKNKKEVYGVMLDFEISQKKRVIYENEHFIAICPYVSHSPYEIRIFPKKHHPHFEKSEDGELLSAARVLGFILKSIKKNLGDPAYNLLIHTSPVHFSGRDANCQDFYRWHIEILPRLKFDGGFEAGTGIQINIIDPDYAAELLKHESFN